jgi:hypothetical protein
LKPKYDEPLSSVAFKFKVRRYNLLSKIREWDKTFEKECRELAAGPGP